MATVQMNLEELEMVLESTSKLNPLYDRLKRAHTTETLIALGLETVKAEYKTSYKVELACDTESVYQVYENFKSVPFFVYFYRWDEMLEMEINDHFKVWVSMCEENGKWYAEV